MERYYFSLDLGGTKTTGALFTLGGEILENYVYITHSKTYEGQGKVFEHCCHVIEHVLSHLSVKPQQVLGIGIGAPGPLDTRRQLIRHAPMMGWHNFPIGSMIGQRFSVPTALDNDGNLGALAEQRCGVAKGCSNVAYMTVSTGIGGGLVLNRRLYRGRRDGAGEFGHLCIEPNGLPCRCGARGCIELYASGSGLKRKMEEDMRAGAKSSVFEQAQANDAPLDARQLLPAAEMGDAYALALLEQEGTWLGRQTATIFNIVDPDMLVIGGGVAKSSSFFHKTLMSTARQCSINPIDDHQVQYSKLNDHLILYGAFYLISETE